MHLVVRAGLPPTAGNLVTARRLAANLMASGVDCRILAADTLTTEARPDPSDIVHALHANGAGVAALAWAGPAPVLWTFTGTDLAPRELAALAPAVPGVRRLIAFHDEAAAQVRHLLPTAAARVRVIPPGVPLPPVSPTPPHAGVDLLLPAGIRPVKNPDLAVAAAAAIARQGLPVRLWIAGPAREPQFHHAFLERLGQVPFAQYLGELPPETLAQWYERADIVLNTSTLEGLANAVLEAMAHGRAVLATDIPGNRAAIRHGESGWLSPPDRLPDAALLLAQNPALRAQLGAAARAHVRERFSIEAEVRAHLALYRELCSETQQGEVARCATKSRSASIPKTS